MSTSYKQKKPSVSARAAEALFSKDFALGAFMAGRHRTRSETEAQLPSAVVNWVECEGHKQLAHACLTYLVVLELQVDGPDEDGFVELLRQIRDGAKTIRQAADALAEQIQRHKIRTGEDDFVRWDALFNLGRALNREFESFVGDAKFHVRMTPTPLENPLDPNAMTHGLSNCAALYNEADRILKGFQQFARNERAAGRKALPGTSGNRTDVNRDAFIADLADIFERGLKKRPSANRGSETSVGAVSPFARFVKFVYAGLLRQSEVEGFTADFRTPSIDTIKAILDGKAAARNSATE